MIDWRRQRQHLFRLLLIRPLLLLPISQLFHCRIKICIASLPRRLLENLASNLAEMFSIFVRCWIPLNIQRQQRQQRRRNREISEVNVLLIDSVLLAVFSPRPVAGGARLAECGE